MKLKHLGIFLLLSTMAVFSACSDDDDDKGVETGLATSIAGDYKGSLIVDVAGSKTEPSDNVINVIATAKEEVQLQLKEFNFVLGDDNIVIRDIKLDKIGVQGKEGDVQLVVKEPQIITIKVGGAPIDAKIMTEGSVKAKNLVLVLDIDAAAMKIKVDFSGVLQEKK